MLGFFITFFILSMASWGSSIQPFGHAAYSNIVDVIQFGAIGDGKTDDSQAFLRAWTAVCQAKTNAPILLIPAGKTFLLKPVRFGGPCMSSSINVMILGNIVAPDITNWNGYDNKNWLVFAFINGLNVYGNGQIDGQGASWWQKVKDPNKRPTILIVQSNNLLIGQALAFVNCNNLRLSGLKHINSQNNHITITGCKDVNISNLRITAPDSSPNTDGIDIGQSSNVQIRDCVIGTGDDCIAIANESSNIFITGVSCGPGHGISIGSLGANGGAAKVENIHVRDCSFKGTTNGARIKTWQGGSGYARKIYFERIAFVAAANPIIIDQYYCPHNGCNNQTSAVQVSDVFYNRMRGTSSSKEAIQLSCSQNVGCNNIMLNDINIRSSVSGVVSHTSCINAHGISTHSVPAVDCLKH